MADKYRLLKEIIVPRCLVKIGTIAEKDEDNWYVFKNEEGKTYSVHFETVETDTQWFEKVVDEVETITILFHPKERYEVNKEIFDHIMFGYGIMPEQPPIRYTQEMVEYMIKKEKLYTEEDMRKCWDEAKKH